MKVAFVHDWLLGMRGGEKVLETLLDLWPQADIFTLFHDPGAVSEAIRSRRVIASALDRIPGARRFHRRFLPLYPWAIGRFSLDAYDLTVSVSHCVAKGARAGAPGRHLCYCLTPMRYLWSHYEAYFGAGRARMPTRAVMAALRGPLRRWDVASCDRVGRFVAISDTVAERIRTRYGREAPVVFPPVETEYFTPGGDPSNYLLIVSALVPYKRVDLAVRACARLAMPLKVVGEGPCGKALRRLAGPGTEFLGWVSQDRLRALYRGCRGLLFPADDDFGIAPVEAQACGRPVLAYRGGGALETVVEGETGAFFDEQSEDCLIEGIMRFVWQAFDPARARQNALRFDRARFLENFRGEVQRFLEAGPDRV